MKTSQLKRDLERKGVVFENGSKHWILHFNGRSTLLKRHPTKELSPTIVAKILKVLGL